MRFPRREGIEGTVAGIQLRKERAESERAHAHAGAVKEGTP
jgi:hypothetical protein